MPDDKSHSLDAYYKKRSADVTSEPFGTAPRRRGDVHSFVVHKHAATRLHHDLRLEWNGVLLSWAVPRGPSQDPKEKRLAVATEPHPIEYANFEGVIPKGNYGAGAMIMWDRGQWIPLEDPDHGFEKGKLLFELRGHKLRGVFTLVHTKGGGDKDWLLIKKPDSWMVPEGEQPYDERSVLSGLTVEELASGDRRAERVREALRQLEAPTREVTVDRVKPMLAMTADAPFSDPDWIFEIKYDGYRVLAGKGEGGARLFYRSGRESSDVFPDVARFVAAQPVERFVLDGEVVVLDDEGRPSFSRLQRRAGQTRRVDVDRAAIEYPAVFYAFDLLGFEQWDLRGLPLVDRKRLLALLLPGKGVLQYADHIPEVGEAMFQQVDRMGLEGIMAKRASSRYVEDRSDHWLKIRADRTGDFAVVGYTEPKGSRQGVGALALAVWDPAAGDSGGFVYCGRVGTGFNDADLRRFADEFAAAEPGDPPQGDLEPGVTYHWVDPELVVEVRYKEWTDSDHLRHPVFVRRRDDKRVEACHRDEALHIDEAPVMLEEEPTAEREVKLTNQSKVFWPQSGYTKGDLVGFYSAIAPWLLPWLDERPVVLTRYPDGIEGKNFFQKDAPAFLPEWIRRERMWSHNTQREIDYLIVEHPETLAYIGNMGSIPIHVWSSRMPSLQQPDWSVIDLDPKEAPFEHVIRIALAVRRLCREIELPCFVKTTGSTGLHILLPLMARFSYEQSQQIALLLAKLVTMELGDIATTARSLKAREGKVYVDCLQNGHGRLIVAPYSVRPRPGAPVSTPLHWDEVEPGLDQRRFTIRTVLDRVAALDVDPCLAVLTTGFDIARTLSLIEERMAEG